MENLNLETEDKRKIKDVSLSKPHKKTRRAGKKHKKKQIDKE